MGEKWSWIIVRTSVRTVSKKAPDTLINLTISYGTFGNFIVIIVVGEYQVRGLFKF